MNESLEDEVICFEVICYKVVTEEMQSLGLRRNPTILTYKVDKEIAEMYPMIGPCDMGGIWASKTRGRANEVKKYMKEKYNVDARLFEAWGRGILYESRNRYKLEEIFLEEEII